MIKNIRDRIIAILDALDHEEWLPGIKYLADNNPPALEFGGHTTIEPDDDDFDPDCCAILMGGLLSVLWARWRSKKLDPRLGSYQGSVHIAVFDMNQADQEMHSFPIYRAESTNDLDCLIMAMELELGLIEDK